MEEAQRFLRYTVPGPTFTIEFLGYLLISRDVRFRQLIGQVNNIGVALSFFLASGVLGFLLGAIYYPLVWLWKDGADLRPALHQAESEGWLKLSCCSKGVETTKLSKRGAWRVVTSYLNMRAETSKQIKGAIRGIDRLSNLVNALGTTCLASVMALIFFLIYNISHNWLGKFSFWGFFSFVIGFLMLIVHYLNYKGVIEDYENVARSILLKEFEHERGKSFGGVKLHVFKNDLKRGCLKTESQD